MFHNKWLGRGSRWKFTVRVAGEGNMQVDYSERRKHIRVYFEPSQTPVGELGCANSISMGCVILDISMGGVHVSIDEKQDFAKGDKLTMSALRTSSESVSEEGIDLEVCWVFSHPEFEKTYLGCRFGQLSKASRNGIANLIKQEMMLKQLD